MAIMKIKDNNGNFIDIPNIQGKAATVSVGTVTTLEAGSNATVTNVGTEKDAIFNFGIPKGKDGSAGTGGSGTSNYSDLSNKPKINNIELTDNKTLDDLGIQPKGNYASSDDIPTNLSDLNNDSDFLRETTMSDYIATQDNLGFVKIGSNIVMDPDGTIHALTGNNLDPNDGTVNLYTLSSGIYISDGFKGMYYSTASPMSEGDNFQPDPDNEIPEYLFPGDLLVHYTELNEEGVLLVNSFIINSVFIKHVVYDGTTGSEELNITMLYWNDLAKKEYVDEQINKLTIPDKTSDLTNDSGFVDEQYVSDAIATAITGALGGEY